MSHYFVYIVASSSGTLYIGMTNDLMRRIYEHKNHLIVGFTDRYDCTKLVYYETYPIPSQAISREKQLKGWVRKKKEKLIHDFNSHWEDLSIDGV